MEHIIKNYNELGTTELRRNALDIIESGIDAILTKNVIRGAFSKTGGTIKIHDSVFTLADYRRVFFLGIGKCAVDAALEIEELLPDTIMGGVVIDVKAGEFKKLHSYVGTHPYPSEQNVVAAKEAIRMLSGLTEKDLVIVVISGGGSSLFSLPHGISTEILTSITKTLMDKGAPISEVNIVRKHLSDVQGGFLAKTLYPAKVIALLFSDVPGNDISTIASGPTVLDKSTKADAEAIIEKYGIKEACGLDSLAIIETPKEEKYFTNVHNFLAVTNDIALGAMSKKSMELGYVSVIRTNCAEGEARDFGEKIVLEGDGSRGCFLYGGETTVMVTKQGGTGGRNQEVVLGALPFIKEGSIIVALSSDGWDNSDCAGAIGDTELLRAAEAAGEKPEDFLTENNSFEFFSKVGGHLKTGRTGANVADIYFVLTK
jgi:glycerate-2-kinase